jgi:hypothetical protein
MAWYCRSSGTYNIQYSQNYAPNSIHSTLVGFMLDEVTADLRHSEKRTCFDELGHYIEGSPSSIIESSAAESFQLVSCLIVALRRGWHL